jgi:hypothetical protein
VPWHRSRSARRWVLALTGLLILVVAVRWMPAASNHLALLWWQRQCLAHVGPPDLAVHVQSLPARADSTTSIVPPHWQRFYARLSPPGLVSGGTAFLHERRAGETGASKLVAVDVLPTSDVAGGINGYALNARVFEPGTLLHAPRELNWTAHGGGYGFDTFSTSGRVFAGQPDATDPARFTIVTETDGRRQTIDGWLMADDSVLLERRR